MYTVMKSKWLHPWLQLLLLLCVGRSLLSVMLSPCGCKYVSNMCLLKRVPLHRLRSRLEEDGVHGCCASSGVPAGSEWLWKGFLRTAEAPLLLRKTHPATTYIVMLFFHWNATCRTQERSWGMRLFSAVLRWGVTHTALLFAACFMARLELCLPFVLQAECLKLNTFPVVAYSISCLTCMRWINACYTTPKRQKSSAFVEVNDSPLHQQVECKAVCLKIVCTEKHA